MKRLRLSAELSFGVTKNSANELLKCRIRISIVDRRGHKHRAYCASVRYFAILLPCLFISAQIKEVDVRPKFLYGGGKCLELVLEKTVNIWDIMCGIVQSSVLKPGESRGEGTSEFGGSGARDSLFLFGDGEPLGNKPSETQANATKKPEISSAKGDAENVHPSPACSTSGSSGLKMTLDQVFWKN